MSKTHLMTALVLAAGIVAVPLYVKSSRSPPTPAGPSPRPAAGVPNATSASPRFVDLGTTTCAPCRVMLGVMQELEQTYPDSMIVEFINVQERPEQAERFGIQMIPSQIFYGPDGRELYRHTGVIRTDAVIAKWAELGFHFKPAAGR